MRASENQEGLKQRLISSAAWIGGFLVLIWALEVIDALLGQPMGEWGILPRTWHGLWGILVAPFLHHGYSHVAMNTAPFIILGGLVILRGVDTFIKVSFLVALLGGAGTWLFGRNAIHAGASTLIFGYFGYLIARGWFERSAVSIFAALLTVVLYGSLVWGVFPSSPYISWEGHLFGLLAGILVAKGESPGSSEHSA